MTIVDLKHHNATVDNMPIMQDGQPTSPWVPVKHEDPWQDIYKAYEQYKYSVPDGTPDSRYFYAKPESELTSLQLLKNQPRSQAKAKLELLMLECIVTESATWPDPSKWFLQSEQDPDLVLLREWFNNQKGAAA